MVRHRARFENTGTRWQRSMHIQIPTSNLGFKVRQNFPARRGISWFLEMIDVAEFRDAGNPAHFRSVWHMGPPRVNLGTNAVVKAWRLALLIGSAILLPIRGAVDRARVSMRRISIGDKSLDRRMVALDEFDCAGHEPRLRIERLGIHDVQAGKFPHEWNAVSLHGFAGRQSEYNYSDQKRTTPHAESQNADTGPTMKIVGQNEGVGLSTARWTNGVISKAGLRVSFHVRQYSRFAGRI